MKNNLLFIVLAFATSLMVANQSCGVKKKDGLTPTIDMTKDIPVLVRLMEVDNLGNIYVVDQANRLYRYNQNGELLFDYFNKRLGPIALIDVTNPLEPTIFFERFGEVKVLDNTLNEVRSFSLLNNQAYIGAKVVAKSNDNNVWVVDPTDQQIEKVNDRLEVIVETNRYGDLGLQDMNVIKMIEAGNKLVVLTDQHAFLIFDNFGQFDKMIPARGAKDFQFDGVGITYETMTGYRYQKIKFPDFTFINLPEGVQKSDVIKARKIANGWVIGYASGVDILID